MSTGTTLIGVHDVQCWVPQGIMEVKTIFLKDKSHLFWTLFPRHFGFFCFCLFIVCKISCKHFVSVYYCELGFDLDRKSANFGFIISARYELAFSFNYEFVMIFLWNYNILIMVINFYKAWWNRALITVDFSKYSSIPGTISAIAISFPPSIGYVVF